MTEILVPVSVGELLDKVTILRIKEQKIQEVEKLANIRSELSALVSVCKDQSIAIDSPDVGDLQKVNESLWDVEDALRDMEREGHHDHKFIELARSVYRFNDERFAIKSRINTQYGSKFVEEKSYKEY